MSEVPDFNTAGFQQDLYANYARLREATPVHRSVFNDHPRFSILRYADVAAGLRDDRLRTSSIDGATTEKLLASGNEALANLVRMQRGFPVLIDPPAHTRLRSLVQRAFTPRAVDALRPRIEALCQELLDPLAREGRGDLMAALAVPLPVVVIAELLGVPAADRARLKQWSDRVAPMLDRTLQAAALGGAMTAALEFTHYFRPLAEARRLAPRDDLLSALVAARDEGDALDDEEVIAVSLFLLAAGHETTTNLIGNGVQALLLHPEQWAWLRGRPEDVPAAVEEMLRYESPVQRTVRVCREPVEVSGFEIPPDVIVDLVIGSANRDPARFDEPDVFDVHRRDNRHLAFGGGIHFCLGAHLARLEAQIAIRGLLERFPTLKAAEARPRFRPGSLLRGLERLPVSA